MCGVRVCVICAREFSVRRHSPYCSEKCELIAETAGDEMEEVIDLNFGPVREIGQRLDDADRMTQMTTEGDYSSLQLVD